MRGRTSLGRRPCRCRCVLSPRCCSSCARVYTLGSKRLLLCMAKSQLSAGVWWCRGRRRAVGSSSPNFSGARGTSPGSPTGKPAGIRIESQVPDSSHQSESGGAAGSWADEKSRGRPPGQRRAPGVRDSGCAAHRVSRTHRHSTGPQTHSTTLTRTHLLCSYREPVEKPIRA